MPPTAWDFQNRLSAILNGARLSGKAYVDVESGYLHRQVEGHPNSNRSIPVCCDVMIRMMRAGDSILKEPKSGEDPKLIIRYIVQPTTSPNKSQTKEAL